jgi:hypothetical protein
MTKPKSLKRRDELEIVKEEILHELRVFHIRVSEELSKLSQALSTLDRSLERYHHEMMSLINFAHFPPSGTSSHPGIIPARAGTAR